MKNSKKFADRIERLILWFSLLFALIIVAGMIFTLFARPLGVYLDQEIIGQYTLAVTVVLAVAALAGGGTILMASYFRRELEHQRKEAEAMVEATKAFAEDIRKLRDLAEEELVKLRKIYFPEWEVNLDLAREIKRALETPKLANCKQCLGELARIFDRHSTLKAHTMRLFTAKEPREVKASAMTLFNMAPEWGKRIIESRLNFERSSAFPNTDLIEFLSRLLGLWGQALKEE